MPKTVSLLKDRPRTRISVPTAARMPASFHTRFIGMLSSSTFMNFEASAGFTTKATKSEEPRAIMKVMGRYFMKEPIMPGQKSSGTNTITVAVVAAMIGMVTSPTANFVARNGGSPLVMWR